MSHFNSQSKSVWLIRLRALNDPPDFVALPNDSASPPLLSGVPAPAPLSPAGAAATYLPETAPYGEQRGWGGWHLTVPVSLLPQTTLPIASDTVGPWAARERLSLHHLILCLSQPLLMFTYLREFNLTIIWYQYQTLCHVLVCKTQSK